MRFKFITVLTLIVSIFSVTVLPALASTQDEIRRAQAEKERLERELESQKNTSKTLAEQIAYTENQIWLNELEIQDTQSRIQSTQNLIVETSSKIEDLTRKLDILDDTMKQMQEVAEARIRDAYKQSRTPEFGVLVRSGSFADAMKTYEYLKALEAEDARVLALVSENQKNYGEEKDNLEALKAEKESLNKQLEADQERIKVQQSELDSARDHKDRLLAESKNDEAYFSEMIARQEAQIRALSSAIVAPNVPKFWANRGDIIARQGNTGCSFGSHLHFGYRAENYGTSGIGSISAGGWDNPKPLLDSGRLFPPLAGYNGQLAPPEGNGNITQLFGHNWNNMYDQDGHPAMDMSDYFGAPIYAAESGWAVRMTDNGCGFGPGKGIIITHADGSGQTLYWHIQ